MKELQIFIVDAFTNQQFKGNPAGVVFYEDVLSKSEMIKIAKELNQTETAFILKPNDKTTHVKVRYFTVTQEIDFCGHATIALAWILGTKFDFVKDKKSLILNTNVGLIPIDWVIEEGVLK